MKTRCLLMLASPALLAGMQPGRPLLAQTPSPPATQTICPWLSAGSVAKALGGEVDVISTGANATEGSCRFSRRDSPTHWLEIAVGPGALPGCPAGSIKLAGIGNEAARCSTHDMHGDTSEMLSGRVRDVPFSLTLREPGRDQESSDPQNDALEQLAEQVAGNLF
ncbi:MAG TPA: hypothetical protein VME23_12515 [Terracidiphilus sp.]|nr:hypothetical protein [Terracidiphilus sp.]